MNQVSFLLLSNRYRKSQVSSAGLTGEVVTASVQPTLSGAGAVSDSVSQAQQPSTSQPQVCNLFAYVASKY